MEQSVRVNLEKAEIFACGALFFHSWQEARSLMGDAFAGSEDTSISSADGYNRMGNAGSERDFRLEYDYLFRGTDADFLPPLWASFAKEDRALCNAVTLDVIRFYHRYGYVPEHVEGNPPDYIGEQLSFLAYLYAAGETKTASDFIQLYTLDHLRAVWKAVETRGTWECIQTFLRDLLRETAGFATKRTFPLPDSIRLCLRRRSETGLDPAVPDEEPHVIHTAGLNNCGGKCVIRPTVAEGCILRIESDCSSNDPQIRACVRGRSYRRTFLAPERLRYPMKRVGERGSGKFERISWEGAVGLVAAEWVRIRDTYGPEARYVQYASGVTGILQPPLLASDLLALDGGYLGFFNSYSSACVGYVADYIFGTPVFGSSPQEMLNANLVVLWGNNEAETIIGSERNYYLSQLKSMGKKVIVIDPRMSQTAVAYADKWIAVRPTTDSALADAVAYVLWEENLQDQAFMDMYCLGFDEEHMPEGIPAGESFQSYILGKKDGIPKTPEWAEGICGVAAEEIRELARLIGTVKPAFFLAGYGPQRHSNGEQTTRSICALAAMTGNIGKSGTAAGSIIFTMEHAHPSAAGCGVKNPYPGAIPSFLWTKAVENGPGLTPRGDRLKGVDHLRSGIKMIVNLAGNILINQHSDINRTIRLLRDESLCEFILCSDIFMTPSARFADVLLPATCVFESENITPPWRGDNYLLKNNPVIPPLFECRFEYEWLGEVARKLGLYDAFTKGRETVGEILRESYEALQKKEPELPDYETFSRLGGWKYRDPVSFIPFKEQIRDLEHHPFPTPSGRIEIFSPRLYEFGQEDIPAIPRYVACPEGPEDPLRETYPLQLIGWHTRRRCHSTHDNNEWLDEIEKPGLWIHPRDAAARNIQNQDMVRVFNDRGAVEIPAVVTKRIREGVVAMSQGGWYKPDKDGVDHRGSINVLTGTEHPSPLAKGNPQHTNLVQVVACRK